jgi:hypothetical protein
VINEPYSIAVAASIEAEAKEVVAAASLYQRLPEARENLATGLELLMDRLNDTYKVFLSNRATEAARASEK